MLVVTNAKISTAQQLTLHMEAANEHDVCPAQAAYSVDEQFAYTGCRSREHTHTHELHDLGQHSQSAERPGCFPASTQ